MSVMAPLFVLTMYFMANFPSCRVGFSMLGCTNELRADSELSLFQGEKPKRLKLMELVCFDLE